METILSISNHILYYLYHLLFFFSSQVFIACRVISTLVCTFTQWFTQLSS
jgi:hypothetical protein